jgi:hypothetical protein
MSPNEILLRSFVKLGDDLTDAFATPRQDVEHEREQYVYALNAIGGFLEANNAPSHLAQRFYRLAIVLNDLNRGRINELTRLSPTGGINPGDATTEWLARANAALGMAVLIAAGSNRKQAAKAAMGSTGMAVSKLLSWYDEFRKPANKSKIKNSLAREVFDQKLKIIEAEVKAQELSQDSWHRLADHFFASAVSLHQKQS